MSKPVPNYPGWYIAHDPKPIPSRDFDYDFHHDDYDGENGLAGSASSYNSAVLQIKSIEEDLENG